MEQYLNLNIGAKRRLEILRKNAAKMNTTWQKARNARFTDAPELSQGFNGDSPIWYAFNQQFDAENDAHGILNLRHSGWFLDVEQNARLIGVAAKLTRDKWLAGYRNTDTGEHVYYPTVYADAVDAARAGDSHAEWVAEEAREYDAKWQQARQIEYKIEENAARLCECFALRNNPTFAHLRDELRELIETIRNARETLANDFADCI